MFYRNHTTPPGIYTKAYPIPGYGYEVSTDLTEPSGKGIMSYRTHRTSPGTDNSRVNAPGIQKGVPNRT